MIRRPRLSSSRVLCLSTALDSRRSADPRSPRQPGSRLSRFALPLRTSSRSGTQRLLAPQIIMQAFARNGIEYVRLEGGGKKEAVVTKFIEDPAVAAFFLVRDLAAHRQVGAGLISERVPSAHQVAVGRAEPYLRSIRALLVSPRLRTLITDGHRRSSSSSRSCTPRSSSRRSGARTASGRRRRFARQPVFSPPSQTDFQDNSRRACTSTLCKTRSTRASRTCAAGTTARSSSPRAPRPPRRKAGSSRRTLPRLPRRRRRAPRRRSR